MLLPQIWIDRAAGVVDFTSQPRTVPGSGAKANPGERSHALLAGAVGDTAGLAFRPIWKDAILSCRSVIESNQFNDKSRERELR